MPHRLLLVDDDDRLRERLARAFERRGLDVLAASDAEQALAGADAFRPELAVLDLRMPEVSGLELLEQLMERHPDLRAVVLTGYGSIATALASVRRGAADYLTKPADADQILAALGIETSGPATTDEAAAPVAVETPSLERVEWEHIQRVLNDCGGNVSRAAKALGVHRRTLQRKLANFAPRR